MWMEDHSRVTSLSATTLASDPGTVAEWDLHAAAGETGRNPEAGRRGAEAWHPDGAGSIHPAGGDAGSATQVGPDVFRSQLRVRPARSAQQYMTDGHRWVVDLDLEKLLDTASYCPRFMKVVRIELVADQ